MYLFLNGIARIMIWIIYNLNLLVFGNHLLWCLHSVLSGIHCMGSRESVGDTAKLGTNTTNQNGYYKSFVTIVTDQG